MQANYARNTGARPVLVRRHPVAALDSHVPGVAQDEVLAHKAPAAKAKLGWAQFFACVNVPRRPDDGLDGILVHDPGNRDPSSLLGLYDLLLGLKRGLMAVELGVWFRHVRLRRVHVGLHWLRRGGRGGPHDSGTVGKAFFVSPNLLPGGSEGAARRRQRQRGAAEPARLEVSACSPPSSARRDPQTLACGGRLWHAPRVDVRRRSRQ